MLATAGDGAAIWYDHSPGPRPVLFLHGFASDHAQTWVRTGWTRPVSELGHVLVDLRGHGSSARATSGYSPDDLALDALAVLDAAEVESVDVVAYSMGGHVGWALARLAPQRVGRLVLGGIGGGPVDRENMLRVREALSGDQPDACVEGMSGHLLDGPPPAPALFAAGDRDEIAGDVGGFAARLGAPFVPLGGRNHLNAVSSRAFKTAALEFLGG
ncbi:alpha/beta fold hydrolase [Saccharopolyspora griseoalba]|uniref:Alpha/beta fold hydrolase n=1 Tax=Saccharopolyspora griseoalba TaxID=1431848 RepID=A0ABW2LUI1_9PSEU